MQATDFRCSISSKVDKTSCFLLLTLEDICCIILLMRFSLLRKQVPAIFTCFYYRHEFHPPPLSDSRSVAAKILRKNFGRTLFVK